MDRARRHRYCPLDLPTFDELCNIADDELFGRAMQLPNHVLHALIPHNPQHRRYTTLDIADTHYNCHHTPLACQTLNFITRMLYKDKY